MKDTLKWLRDFYTRYENDTRALLAIEPFWRACNNCPDGHCCVNQTIPVMSPEWENIVQFVRENLSPRNKDRLRDNIETGGPSCPYLFGRRCAIHTARPFACRLFPYSISFIDGRANELVFKGGTFLPPYCVTLASDFGNQIDADIQLNPEVVKVQKGSHLVKIRFLKPRDLWVIDRSDYYREYQDRMPKAEEGKLDGSNFDVWYDLPMYAFKKRKITEEKLRELLGLDQSARPVKGLQADGASA